jgi:molecular chaperone GrpE
MSEQKTLKKRSEERKSGGPRAEAESPTPLETLQSPSPAVETPPPGESPVEAAAAHQEETLADRLAAAQEEARGNYDRFLRVSAEFENYKKRAAREAEDYRRYANEALLRELLTVVDNLERALEVPADAGKDAGLREGIDLTLKQLYKLLEQFAVAPIEVEGQLFDPARHQAMMQETCDHVPDNTVIRQMQKGYTIHDRLLRPAMVVVAKAAAKGGDAPPGADAAEAQS